MTKPVSKKEEMAIIEAIKEGNSLNKVAKQFKRSVSTISRCAKRNDVDVEHSRTKKAVEIHQRWNKEKRFELIGEFFDKLRDVIQVTSDPRELKDLSTALGIVIDKARLEEGEPTEITKNETDVRNHDDKLRTAVETIERIANGLVHRNDSSKQVDSTRADNETT
mgnify:CR=1 FL=1